MHLRDLTGPEQLKRLAPAELAQLAAEIRRVILETVATNGGHLAPNLGVVELTLALHIVFDSPRDKILWDVSHQSYVHKLLTGRLHQFHTLRQFGGIAGFTDPRESVHDHFHWGHASTSISAAVGMAKARDLAGDDYEVVAVIGDGALTGGMAYEALDHAGHDKTKVIVVLNDNSMSIAPNVGGISNYLARIRTGPSYQRVKHDVAEALRQIPLIGPQALELADRLKEGVKHLLVHNMFFEDLGFTYLGPVDGHNVSALVDVLRQARAYPGPTVVHVVTTKGKGVPYAEQLPDKFHGGGPFDVATGRTGPGSLTYSEVFGNVMCKLAAEDPRVCAITAAMPSGTGLSRFARQFPDRYFDVGIAEQHAVTFAAGLAKGGMRPVFAVYSTFLQRAYDQVIHDVALQNLPVTLAIDRGGLVEDGATHQGVFDVAYLRAIPNMVVMAPKDENELQHMLYTALCHDGPAALRYPRGKAQGVPLDETLQPLPIGRGEVMQEGADVALIGLGTMARVCQEAARLLAEKSISAMVINPRFVKPLDAELLLRAGREVGAVVTVEEACLAGGFGSAVLELYAAHGVNARVERMGIPDEFVDHGQPARYLERYGLTPEGVAQRAEALLLRMRSDLAAQPARRSRSVRRLSGAKAAGNGET
ncbi:1-deoxy-D-xylulose-5-phosphate synthase [Symbiobacterium thermophilum]|uniref:1-deoxy-D-xylulose-5-phosphate synthase n=2 Tax=Symbiobacterium thermophilum TaxID=2734 RepID=DXS_SYMTH|nr:1-deoxy-D-xylulose-5-phosphate synthase [Symbiobacterium thermophilum]Q67NB6.1 RecName: Full=1-deoxy-D-xylulose-5-phosphate synthase; AltName: Full=1-deoxyxylulose-5-phosphate synthase; Short=DXP synthase; Short=DXPS [Symbiobacterium thermophilum IAM 14863]BAD40827.1 1-deoxy-xylulose 5-phosphate synthase [Symbiobacterium thermophilum IAM 14863]